MLKKTNDLKDNFISLCLQNELVLIIFALALAIRLFALNHGYPFIFHPDEPSVVRSALGIRFELNPKHFDWPHLYFYVNYFLFIVFARVRSTLQSISLKPVLMTVFPILWDDNFIFYSLARMLTGIIGALTVFPIYLAGKNLFTKNVGIFSALLISIIPLHVAYSHLALIDVPMLFLFSWAVYFSILIYYKANLKNYILAGLFAGLSASTKYNGGLSLLVIFTAHFLRIYNESPNIKKYLLKLFSSGSIKNIFFSCFASILAFVLGTPYSVLDFKTFIRIDSAKGALWQFSNVGHLDFPTHLVSFFQNLLFKLSDNFGYSISWLFVIFIIIFILRFKYFADRAKILLLLIPALVLFYIVSGVEKTRSHYFFVVYPFVLILVSYFIYKFRMLYLNKHRFLVYIPIFLIFLAPLIASSILLIKYASGDTRNALYRWGLRNVNSSDYVFFSSDSLKPIADRLNAFNTSRISSSFAIGGRQGFIFFIFDNDKKRSIEMVIKDTPSYNFKRETVFDSKFMTGPKIGVYSFNK